MGANADSDGLRVQSGGWIAGLLGRTPLIRARGAPVAERLDVFVAPSLEEEEPKDLTDVDWVRLHNAKVRDCLKGSTGFAQRLNNDPNEPEPVRPPERVLKGEAFMVKMLEQRRRKPEEQEIQGAP